jgi:hypothetical protein
VTYRILRTTWQPPPDGHPRWSTRLLARTLRVNHMQVYRVWKSHGILVPSSTGDPPPIGGRAPPEVLGLYLESPAAVAIRVPSADDPASDSELPTLMLDAAAPDPSRSGGYRPGTRVRTSLGLIAALDRAYEARRPAAHEPRWTSPELLVFLRSIAERSRNPGEVHLFFDRPLPAGVPRFDAWVTAHPEVTVHDPDPGERWTVALDRWLRSGPLRSTLEDRLLIAAPFDATIARAFGPGPDGRAASGRPVR